MKPHIMSNSAETVKGSVQDNKLASFIQMWLSFMQLSLRLKTDLLSAQLFGIAG